MLFFAVLLIGNSWLYCLVLFKRLLLGVGFSAMRPDEYWLSTEPGLTIRAESILKISNCLGLKQDLKWELVQ
ncbi:hypothetical protein L6452_38936 [Arctium lappa]|uniref:Uncharacterized protein n=1 Tax=Arctium lappa TaxID=4217 RepID=A0ACB8XRI8_ARCLA|nr:hypothetical protein L6452_38936 [Arctium lappa]